MKIAFTSCMDAERNADQPVWGAIQSQAPEVLLLLGDQIYMDWGLSLAKVPALKKKLDQDPAEAIEAYADEMYGRYRAQWGVPSFRRCVTSIADRSRILMTWDDHDFAWNDAYGAGTSDRSVPQAFKKISASLAGQFLRVVRSAGAEDPYPAPDLATASSGPGAQRLELDGLGALLLLDQRWSRTQRDETDARLLSDADRQLLLTEAGTAGGLLIVAGSSPMKHGYLLSHQGWWANVNAKQSRHEDSRSYPEYASFVAAAGQSRRPILYLGGDIHRNAYGGPVEPGSSIVQVLSSGAALGRLLFRTFPRCFGTVTLGAADGRVTNVDIALYTGDDANPPRRRLVVQDRRWQEPLLEGECSELALDADKVQETEAHLEQGELTVLCYRERDKDRRNEDDLTLKASELDTEAFIDALPLKENSLTSLDSLRDWPEPVRVSGGAVAVRVQRLRGGDNQITRVIEYMQAACISARATTNRSVVLFIHGFNKTFSTSINQACELRECFDCVPLLYSWPSGGDGGLWATLGGFVKSQKTAAYGCKGLNATLGQLCLVARAASVRVVVVARSMGAEALRNAVVSGALGGATGVISRVILSAPSSPLNDRLGWLLQFGAEAVVTINRNDEKLRYADLVHNGTPLGRELPDADHRVGGITYLDCSDVAGVDRSHDYLLRRVNEPLFALNRALVRGEDISGLLNVPGLQVFPATT